MKLVWCLCLCWFFFFFKQKTAYELRISDWSSDVCSSDLLCKANGLDPVFAVEGDGKYREDWGWLGGQGSVINPKFNAPDGPICSDLREAGDRKSTRLNSSH